MKRSKIDDIEEMVRSEKFELDRIDHYVHDLKECLIDKTPNKFAIKDIARSFFGALLIAFGFVLKGAMVRTAVNMDNYNMATIIASSLLILFVEIYYFGYRKVKDRRERKIGQFVIKRLPTFYLIAAFVSALLVFVYGVNHDPLITSNMDIVRVVVAVSFPASIGAGFSDLMKKY